MQATEIRPRESQESVHGPETPGLDFSKTMLESPNVLVCLWRDLRDRFQAPRVTVPKEYYRGEARLPVLEMRSSFLDLPHTLVEALRKPQDPIGAFNYVQEEKRAMVATLCGAAGAAAFWFGIRAELAPLGAVTGFALGEVAGVLAFKKRAYPQDVFQDYQQESASFLNSVLIHAIGILAIILPFYIHFLFQAPKPQVEITEAMPVPPTLTLPSEKKAGGGGGGGIREPRPASRGKLPVFAKVQLAPPTTHILIPHPLLPVQPTLLGPPKMKLPQMAMNGPWGDPNGVLGMPSNGPGTGGGIGSGTGTGVGPGKGGGAGPGNEAGFGGGYYQVGGDVTAPIAIYRPEPPYTNEARMAKLQGAVVLWITVDAQGNVTGVQVIRHLGLGLDESAVKTVKMWKFKPGMKNGAPVPVQLTVEVDFSLL